jgi:hypothetical protein
MKKTMEFKESEHAYLHGSSMEEVYSLKPWKAI